mmetsp:Transcript_49148/g.116976  ORF Transcript_49148/g.116976 Transcript_49148/m.116976 type:complete len:220 (+) Transcript_49148:294-953(+)
MEVRGAAPSSGTDGAGEAAAVAIASRASIHLKRHAASQQAWHRSKSHCGPLLLYRRPCPWAVQPSQRHSFARSVSWIGCGWMFGIVCGPCRSGMPSPASAASTRPGVARGGSSERCFSSTETIARASAFLSAPTPSTAPAPPDPELCAKAALASCSAPVPRRFWWRAFAPRERSFSTVDLCPRETAQASGWFPSPSWEWRSPPRSKSSCTKSSRAPHAA